MRELVLKNVTRSRLKSRTLIEKYYIITVSDAEHYIIYISGAAVRTVTVSHVVSIII